MSEESNEWDIIIAKGLTAKNYWKDLWRYRELFYILSWRDIKVRYKQTVIGAAWSIIRPLLTTIVFYFDPNCEHCQNEAQALVKQPQLFSNVRLFVSVSFIQPQSVSSK